MTGPLVWTGGAINYAESANTTAICGLDANLNQLYENSGSALRCSDKNGLLLWSLSPSDVQGLFTAAGGTPGSPISDGVNVFPSPEGTKLIFTLVDIETVFFLYVGVADISATGAVAPPVLTNYLKFRMGTDSLKSIGIWDQRSAGEIAGCVLETRDFTTAKVQWFLIPSVADIAAGTYKGHHPGCTGTLAADQGPTYKIQWTHSSSLAMGYWIETTSGTVADNHSGFLVSVGDEQRFYFVVPRAWMNGGSSTNSGLYNNWHTTYPHGGAFYIDLTSYGFYADATWAPASITNVVTISTDATDVTPSGFLNADATQAIPWPDEWTRILDEGPNAGWLASYEGRATVSYAGRRPMVFFNIVDGNPNYAAMIGEGQRVFYARIRAYTWTGAAFIETSQAEGIVLRQGDLSHSDYTFDHIETEDMTLRGSGLYFQCMNCRLPTQGSLLTQFGEFLPPSSSGRGVMVRSIIGPLQLGLPLQSSIPVPPVAPTNTIPPRITGPTLIGGTGTLSTGTWSGNPSGYAAQWYRSAAPITDATSFTYVYVDADEGQDITGIVTASNATGSTPKVSNTVVPTATPSGVPIANATELAAMFAAGVGASGGKTYLLASVSFGAFSLSATDFASNPVIVNGQAGTVFDYLALDNVHGITWGSFNCKEFGPTGSGIAVTDGSSHITFNQVTSNAAVSAGTQSGNGIQIRDSSFVTFHGQNDSSLPDIYGRGAGVAMLTSANLTFTGMTLQNIEEDGFLIDGVATGLFDSCLGFDWYAQTGGHPDFFQWFSVAGPNSNITIINSGWLRENGTGVFNGASQGFTGEGDSTNFVLADNYCFGGLTNSFQQSGGVTTQFDNCFCQGFADYGSRIIVRGASVNATVTNNTAGNVFNYAGDGVNPGFVPDPLPGSNTLIGDTTAGNYAALDTWLAAHPSARARP